MAAKNRLTPRPKYVVLNESFTQIRRVFEELIKRQAEIELKSIQIERDYWDAPVLHMAWVGGDGIWRNIAALVIDERKPETLKVEINAWHETRQGDRRYREWHAQEIDRLTYMPSSEELARTITKAYTVVSLWTHADLTERAVSNVQ